MDKYRIIEQNNKFHIEKLKIFFYWKWYTKLGWMDIVGGGIYYFNTLNEAKEHINTLNKKIHNF